ncbi:hypothetical protein Tco_0286267 [Tanacetum coccineum]
MDLKLSLLNRIHLNKSNKTHSTHQKLYDTHYDSIILDQEALDAQDAEPSFHKRTHDDQDPSNDHEGENRKKRRKDVGGSSSRSSRKDKAPMAPAPEDTPADQLQDQEDVYMQNHPNLGCTEEKYATSLTKHYAARYHIQGIKDMIPDRWSKKVHLYYIKALNVIHQCKDIRQDFFKAEINNKSPDKVYSNKRIISVIRVVVKREWGCGFFSSIVVRRSDQKEYTFSYADLHRLNLNDIEDMYLLKVQDKLHHL